MEEERRSYYVILNPNASRGDAAKQRPAIETALRSAGVRYHIAETERRGHATELAQRAVAEGWGAVIAVGGDGVVHEVAEGLVVASAGEATLPLGIVPVGSGNDFVKGIGTPSHQPAEAIRQILASTPRQVDMGKVSGHTMGGGPSGVWYFTNGVGVGFDAQVAQHASRIERLRGFMIYAWAVVKTLSSLRTPAIRVTIDGEIVADGPLVVTTVSNGPCHGGTFWLCPTAAIDDGELDILIADGRSLPALLRLLPKTISGKHVNGTDVRLLRGREVVVSSKEQLPIHADGEIVADWVSHLEISVMPGVLTVLG